MRSARGGERKRERERERERAGSIVPLPPHSISSPFLLPNSCEFTQQCSLTEIPSRCRCSTLSSALQLRWLTFNLCRHHRYRHRLLHPAIFPVARSPSPRSTLPRGLYAIVAVVIVNTVQCSYFTRFRNLLPPSTRFHAVGFPIRFCFFKSRYVAIYLIVG